MVEDSVTDQFPDQYEDLQGFPELAYYRNCIVIGNIPMHVNLEHVYSLVQDAFLWKINCKKIIPDLRYPQMKAVILAYENEIVARLSSFRISKVVENSNLSLYDGNSLFLYCQRLESDCDPKSRNVAISGFDTRVPRDVYLELFQTFGSLRYYEFCTEGEIPKARFEYDRVTSSFAAVLSLKGTLDKDGIVALEVPLFQVQQICPGGERHQMVQQPAILQPQSTGAIQSQEGIRELYFMCFMNTMNYPSPEEPWTDMNYTGRRDCGYQQGAYEECSMGSVSFEICRKKNAENSNFHSTPNGVCEISDRVNEETLRMLFLQATKRSSWTFKMPAAKQSIRYLY